MAQYHELANELRAKILNGDWPIGTRLPSISELQEEYDIRSLSTVRLAQQALVGEGLLETRHGVGAFVVGSESLSQVDVYKELSVMRERLTTVMEAMTSQREGKITIDLVGAESEHTFFALTDALTEWAAAQRVTVSGGQSPNFRIEWAEAAERLLERIRAAVALPHSEIADR
ncbi:GntR family transcriptional regulator [Rhodococcus qingshengii]|uniref:GntR family transcriptional regulator n=1 Tax=Rhodococcus qingshengii TaxID=334542 RepID=UPI0036D78A23